MKLKATDIGRSASAASIIFESLRRAIIDGELADGAPLKQDLIAEAFNTSRIPVREALTRLEQHGLIENRRYRGAIVAEISAKEVAEIFDFRCLLEGEVVALSVAQISEQSLQQAREFSQAFIDSTEPMDWGDLNRKFHYALYRDSNLPYHLKIIDNALDRVERYLRAQLLMTDGRDQADREHAKILAACEQGNIAAAADLTRQHISGAKTALLDYLRSRP